MPDPVTCITFGKFGQEENALIMITISEYLLMINWVINLMMCLSTYDFRSEFKISVNIIHIILLKA